MKTNVAKHNACLQAFAFFQKENKLPSHWEASEVEVEIKHAGGCRSDYKDYVFNHPTEGQHTVLLSTPLARKMHQETYVFNN